MKNGATESCMLKKIRHVETATDKKRHVEVKSGMLKKTACASTEVFADAVRVPGYSWLPHVDRQHDT